jgi:hypothetical protein
MPSPNGVRRIQAVDNGCYGEKLIAYSHCNKILPTKQGGFAGEKVLVFRAKMGIMLNCICKHL